MTADAVGGVWDYALELASGLGARGIAVTLATMGPRPTGDQRASARAVPRATLVESDHRLEWMPGGPDDLEAAGAWLLSVARDAGAELVHLNGYAHAALPWTVPTLVVAHSCVSSWWMAVHGTTPPPEWSAYRDRVRDGIRAASAIAAPSRSMLHAVSAHHGPCEGVVIPNGRCAARFQPASKERFIFSAGRLWDPAKNVATLARVARRVEWPIAIAGDTTAPGGEHAMVDGLRALGRLDPAGMREWLARAPIYALPARYEPFGLSILEAALSGCALVLGDIPSLREHWDGAALFVAPDDDAALAATLNGLIADPERRRCWGRRARIRGGEFGTARMVDAYERLYAALRSAAHPAAGRIPCAS